MLSCGCNGLKTCGGTLKNQLEALIIQMHQAGVPLDEAVREFRKQFVTTVLQERKGTSARPLVSFKCIETRCTTRWPISTLMSTHYVSMP